MSLPVWCDWWQAWLIFENLKPNGIYLYLSLTFSGMTCFSYVTIYSFSFILRIYYIYEKPYVSLQISYKFDVSFAAT